MKLEIRESMKLIQRIFLISNKFIHEVDTQHFLKFLYKLEVLLFRKYDHHWYPGETARGSGFRSLQVTDCQMDPLLIKAAKATNGQKILCYLPEFTIWIDPNQVHYAFKDNKKIIPYFKIENSSSSIRMLWPGSNVLENFTQSFISCKRYKKKYIKFCKCA